MTQRRLRWTRYWFILSLLFGISPLLLSTTRAAHAGTPIISIAPAANLPHGSATVSGSGFDPGASVALSVVSSSSTTAVGTLRADDQGVIAGTITLPLNLDATASNMLQAQDSAGAPQASATFTGLAVQPVIGNGQQMSGRVGQTIQIRAVGFAPADPVQISVGGAAVVAPTGFVSGADGTLNAAFQVPAGAQPGTGSLVASGAVHGLGQQDVATLSINIIGSQNMTVTPDPAPAGQSVEVSGSGFAAAEPISITLSYTDTVPNAPAQAGLAAQADASGNLDTRLSIPPTAEANTQALLIARGERSGTSLGLQVGIVGQPTINCMPPTAQPGDTVVVSGSGFRPSERLFVASPLITAPVNGFITDDTGVFSATVTVRPNLAAGIYTLAVSGSGGDQAAGTLTLPPPPLSSLQLFAGTASPGDIVRVQGVRFLPAEPVQLSIDSLPLTPTAGMLNASSSGAFDTSIVLPRLPFSGAYTMTARGLRTHAAATATLNVRLPVASQIYFAEGFTGRGSGVDFSEHLDILNTNPITATGRIQYFTDGGPITIPITIAAQSRLSEDVLGDVGPNKLVSAVVSADQAIVATRTIDRTDAQGNGLAPSVSNGISTLARSWYFAEGYTGVSFQEYLVLFNPSASPISTLIQPFSGSGTAAIEPITQTVPARGRVTLNLRALLPNRSIGLLVQGDQALAAERVLYWGNGSGSGKYGTAVSAGLSGPANLWSFAYASTGAADQTFVSLVNPTTIAAHVRLTSYRDTGQTDLGTIAVPAGSRATIPIALQGNTRQAGTGLVVNSDIPIVGEVAHYFGGSPNTGSHAGSIVPGVSQPTSRWAFPGVSTTGYTSQDWYILNTTGSTARLTATLFSAQAQPVQAQFTAGAGKLTTITLGSISDLESGGSSLWTSTAPVQIVQVLRGGNGTQGAVIGGVAITGA